MILVKKARWAVWLLGARDVVFRCRFGPVISVLPGGSCCSVAWFRPSPSRSSGLPLEQAITVEKREVQKTKRELNVAHVHRPLHWVVYIDVRAKLYGDMNTRSAASTVTYLWQISQNMANAKISHLEILERVYEQERCIKASQKVRGIPEMFEATWSVG